MHWRCIDDALMMHWWCIDDALMMHWWCTDNALMRHCLCADDTLMICWWCADDAWVSYLISLNPQLFKNIAHVWSFQNFCLCLCFLSLSLSLSLCFGRSGGMVFKMVFVFVLSVFFVFVLSVCLCLCPFCLSLSLSLCFGLSGGTGRRCQGGRSPPGCTWDSRSPSTFLRLGHSIFFITAWSRSPSTPGSTRSSARVSSLAGSRACCMCPSPSQRWLSTGLLSVQEPRTFLISTQRPFEQVVDCYFVFVCSNVYRWIVVDCLFWFFFF